MTEKKRGRQFRLWEPGGERRAIMMQHYPEKGAAAVAQMLGLTRQQVIDGAKTLKLKRVKQGVRPSRVWFGERLEAARTAVWEQGIAAAARSLGVPITTLTHVAERYGLKASPEARARAVQAGLHALNAVRSGSAQAKRPKAPNGEAKKPSIGMAPRAAGQRHERYMKARIQRVGTPLPRVASVFDLGEALNA